MVKQGDIISIRGRGRLEVAEVRGTTKKGRTVVLLKRYTLKMGRCYLCFFILFVYLIIRL